MLRDCSEPKCVSECAWEISPLLPPLRQQLLRLLADSATQNAKL